MDNEQWKLERAVGALCYDGVLPDEIAEMARSIAQRYHGEIDDCIAIAAKQRPAAILAELAAEPKQTDLSFNQNFK